MAAPTRFANIGPQQGPDRRDTFVPVAQLQISEDEAEAVDLQPHHALVVPLARSAVLQRTTDGAGQPTLTLYLADKEVAWDDPRHFAFAQALVDGAEFTALEAAEAGALAWDEAAPMLEALIDEGLVVLAADRPEVTDRHDNRIMPSPLPAAPMASARCWTDAASLMEELTGSALDNYWLEVAVPVFRTAHIFLDRDQRHIGEANAFPAAARTDVATEWRGCPYAGNRYQPEKPMNMTALKAMRAHWRQMMGLLLPIREAYLRRFPAARAGWTVAHVERLTVCVLALPSYMLLRCDAPVANGQLHPALSNLFRITDGLRMVMHHMLFVPLYEPMHAPDAPVSAETILAYADRNFLFHSEHAVCAGPRFMVEDFLAVLLDGTTPRSGFEAEQDPELAEAAKLVEPAMNYGLLGLQTHGAVFALWPAMARCYADLHTLLTSAQAASSASGQVLAERFAAHFQALNFRSYLGSEEWRQHRETVYDDMFASCSSGVSARLPDGPLSVMLAKPGASLPTASMTALTEGISRHFGDRQPALVDAFAGIVVEFLIRARNIIALAETIQAEVARVLHRPRPATPLKLGDIQLYNVLMGADQRSVPFIPDELADLFNLRIEVDARHIAIAPDDRQASHHSLAIPAANIRA